MEGRGVFHQAYDLGESVWPRLEGHIMLPGL
jgi:hypothetical protein